MFLLVSDWLFLLVSGWLFQAGSNSGWEFLFLGANIDAGKEAEKIGIARNRSVTYENDPEGVAINFKAVGRAVSKAVQAESMEEVFDGNWSEEIVEHLWKSDKKSLLQRNL